MSEAPRKPVVAISSCLLGNRVRYDGELKHFPELCAELAEYFELRAVCPEVEIGLNVPRPPLILANTADGVHMVGRDDAQIDVTDAMRHFCSDKPQQLLDIAGYVFKARSPSCGLRNLPLYDGDRVIDDNIRGLFAATIVERFPGLPVAEEEDLLEHEHRAQFIQQVLNYEAIQRK